MDIAVLDRSKPLKKPGNNKGYTPTIQQEAFVDGFLRNLTLSVKNKKTEQQIAIAAGYSKRTPLQQIRNAPAVQRLFRAYLGDKYEKFCNRIAASVDESLDIVDKLKRTAENEGIRLRAAVYAPDKLQEICGKKTEQPGPQTSYETYIFNLRAERGLGEPVSIPTTARAV